MRRSSGAMAPSVAVRVHVEDMILGNGGPDDVLGKADELQEGSIQVLQLRSVLQLARHAVRLMNLIVTLVLLVACLLSRLAPSCEPYVQPTIWSLIGYVSRS